MITLEFSSLKNQWEYEHELGSFSPPPMHVQHCSARMKFVRHRPAFFLLVVPRRLVAFPLPYTSTVTAKTYVPLIVVSISLFFLLLITKLVYMKHRRIGTIHTPSGTVHSLPSGSNLSSGTSGFGFRDKEGNRHRGVLVGCLGSPTWETTLTSKLERATWRREQWRRSSFLHTGSAIRSAHSVSTRSKSKNYSSGSRLTQSTALTSCSACSRDADQYMLSLSSGPSCGSSSKTLCSVQRNSSTGCHSRYDDFGEFRNMRSPGVGVPNVARRASPSSIRLVDGPSHSSQVKYTFLSGLPPNTAVLSPLVGTRDSFQLSRCSLKYNRKPVPPMPPLPSFLPFYLPKGPETTESQPLEYLPPLRFSPLASVAKVFYSQQQVVAKTAPISRVPDPDESKNEVCSGVPGSKSTSKAQHASKTGSSVVHVRKTNVKSNHKRSQSYKGLAIGGTSSRTALAIGEGATARRSENESMQTGVLRSASGSSRDGRVISKKPLKSCLRQNSVMPTPLVCGSDFTLTQSTGDSLRTPISDVDVGILGLDRFRWNDEKVQACHAKKDSVALVPYWE